MQVHFYKYHGTGNDFVIFDNRQHTVQLTKEQISFLCHRRFGVGADGLMLLNAHPQYDFEMKYYNADGAESSMCGNGGRCLVQFAFDIGMIKSQYQFIAIDGVHQATFEFNGKVSLKMNDVESMEVSNGKYVLDTGSPHYVEMVNGLEELNVVEKGREVRYSDEFGEMGINVNFVQSLDEPDRIIIRTYERGVEDETYSCGTGVTAAALVCYHNENGYNRVDVETKGGRLSVEFDKVGDRYENIWLIGPATKVFEGDINL